MSAPQVAAVADHIGARYPVYGLLVRFAAYTGLRAAEIAGLEIGDLDLTEATEEVRVRRAKHKITGGWKTGPLKTESASREVPLTEWLADDLRDYLAIHPRQNDESAPLFLSRYPRSTKGIPKSWSSPATPDNPAEIDSYNWEHPVDPDTFYAHYLQRALMAQGLPVSLSAARNENGTASRGIRFHDLRHTFAVLNLSANVHFMVVSKWLGHEKYTTTLDYYSDYMPKEEVRVTLPRPKAAGNVVQLRRTAQ